MSPLKWTYRSVSSDSGSIFPDLGQWPHSSLVSSNLFKTFSLCFPNLKLNQSMTPSPHFSCSNCSFTNRSYRETSCFIKTFGSLARFMSPFPGIGTRIGPEFLIIWDCEIRKFHYANLKFFEKKSEKPCCRAQKVGK